MRKSFSLIAAAAFGVALSSSPGPARAEFMTGNTLYRLCTGTSSEYSRDIQTFMCLAYIQGAHDGLETGGHYITYKAELDEPVQIVCVPDRVEVGQIEELVIAHLRDSPENRNLSASLLVLAAIAKAYPCQGL